jgi:hypothetical protein
MMQPHTMKSALTLLSLCLAGCSTAGSGGSGASASAAPAAGTVVAQNDMPGVCQNAAAAKYNVPLENVSTETPVTRSFGLLIQGSVDGDTNTFGFDCRFSPAGAFLGLITQ